MLELNMLFSQTQKTLYTTATTATTATYCNAIDIIKSITKH